MEEARPIPNAEAARILAAAPRQSGGRPLTRDADLFMANGVAECLHERLELAGVVLMARDE